jgi:hypothetical protein
METEKNDKNSLYPGLGNTFKEIGSSFQGSIPHIIIPTKGDKKPTEPNLLNDKKDEVKINKWFEWILKICIALVLGYASYRILRGIF